MVMLTSEILALDDEPRQYSKCGKWKQNKDFSIARRKSDGRSTVCRECGKTARLNGATSH